MTADNDYKKKNLIGVIRIPKSGSSSLNQMVKQAFQNRKIYGLPDALIHPNNISLFQNFRYRRAVSRNLYKFHKTLSYKGVISRIDQNAKSGDVISGGHIDHGTFTQFESKVSYIVLLRNPVNRFISEYNYSRYGFLKKPRFMRWDATIKAKLAGKYDLHDYALALQNRKDLFGNISANFLGIGSRSEISDRFENSVWISGVLEDIGGFRDRLSAASGINIEKSHNNKTKEQYEISINNKTISIIEDIFSIDFEIYEFVITTNSYI